MCNKPPDNMVTENPLFQLVADSPQNNVIFYTHTDESGQWLRFGGSRCIICGTYELHYIPVDPRRQTTMCFCCYSHKLKQDKSIQDMLKPFQLTDQIFNSHIEKEQKPQAQLIPINQPTF